MQRTFWIIATVLTATAASPAADERAAKVAFEERYGPQMRRVMASRMTDDDAAMAAELFTAAKAATDNPALLNELCENAFVLGMRDPLGQDTAIAAMELIAAKLPLATRALASAEAAGDEFTAAAARLQMAIGLGWRGVDMDRAAALLDRARTAFTDLGERHWAAVTLEFQGLLALRRLDAGGQAGALPSHDHRAAGGVSRWGSVIGR